MFCVNIIQDERHLPRYCELQDTDTTDFRNRKLSMGISRTMRQALENNMPSSLWQNRVIGLHQVVNIRPMGLRFSNKLLIQVVLNTTRSTSRAMIVLFTHTERGKHRAHAAIHEEPGLSDKERQHRANRIIVVQQFARIKEFVNVLQHVDLAAHYNFLQNCLEGTQPHPPDSVFVVLSSDNIQMYYYNNLLNVSNTIKY